MKYRCVSCGKKVNDEEVNIIEGFNDIPIFYCNDCYEEILEVNEKMEEK